MRPFPTFVDEYWRAHPELHNVPVKYASQMAKKCIRVYKVRPSGTPRRSPAAALPRDEASRASPCNHTLHVPPRQTYPRMMNANIGAMISQRQKNPFDFDHISFISVCGRWTARRGAGWRQRTLLTILCAPAGVARL